MSKRLADSAGVSKSIGSESDDGVSRQGSPVRSSRGGTADRFESVGSATNAEAPAAASTTDQIQRCLPIVTMLPGTDDILAHPGTQDERDHDDPSAC